MSSFVETSTFIFYTAEASETYQTIYIHVYIKAELSRFSPQFLRYQLSPQEAAYLSEPSIVDHYSIELSYKDNEKNYVIVWQLL